MKNDSAEIVRVDAEAVQSVFYDFFGVWLGVVSVVDEDEEHVGFYAIIGNHDREKTLEEKAANIWNSRYAQPPRYFDSVGDIIVTYLDILNEQKEST